MGNYFVIIKGKRSGIFRSNALTVSLIRYKFTEYKTFSTLHAAEAYFNENFPRAYEEDRVFEKACGVMIQEQKQAQQEIISSLYSECSDLRLQLLKYNRIKRFLKCAMFCMVIGYIAVKVILR